MNLTIDNKSYTLNVQRSIELGVLKQKTRPILYGDLKNGDIFKFKSEMTAGWSGVYILKDNTKFDRDQAVRIDSDTNVSQAYVFSDSSKTPCKVWRDGTWITEIE